jgi:hypothetical protein
MDEVPKISSDLVKVFVVLSITVNVSLIFLTNLFLVAINLSISDFGGHDIKFFISSRAALGSVSYFSINSLALLIPYAATRVRSNGITILF